MTLREPGKYVLSTIEDGFTLFGRSSCPPSVPGGGRQQRGHGQWIAASERLA